jgi:hypothetical protein
MTPDDNWAIGEMGHDDQVTVVSWRRDIPTSIRGRNHRQFIIEWRFGRCLPNGLPEPTELPRAIELEQLVVPALERDGAAILAVTATGSGVREMFFYCTDPKLLQDRFNECVAGRAMPVTLHVGADPEWKIYAEFTEPFGGAAL